ncbi:hypothetical protein [Microbacterium jiangjiandongii]|uniref:hypothetical protein n=1 Tax=Microbacterium jiangjiandongii TaxID=3049071 RepID=UPI00214CA131|nr:hypothetical protein [Microbacterium sp. zg.Y843]MCR2814583.1 hypothetical protein [Microbacterium sp. zg.Y843]
MHSPTVPVDPAPLAGGGAVLRVVRQGAPWPGTIVRHADGESALHVDAELLQGTTVWRAAPDGHILAPREVVRTASGHEAVFALCHGRLDHVLHERREAQAPPSAGECVTVAVSVLRGTEEAGPGACGQWWVTTEGRPVLALGGTTPAAHASRDILTLMSAHVTGGVADALQSAGAAVADPRPDALERAEDALFAAAEPTPLVIDLPAPARALSVSVTARPHAGPAAALRGALERHVDGDVAEQVGHAGDELRRRWQRSRERRAARRAARQATTRVRTRPAGTQPPPTAPSRAAARPNRVRPVVVACAVAGLVLTAGLLWPSGDGSATASREATPAEIGDASAAATPSPVLTPMPAADPVAAAESLLSTAAACADDTCVSALRETPGRPAIDGVLALPPAERHVTLVDDYGGVAVLRVSADGESSDRLLVIVDAGHKWLIRDAYDVADQP